MLGSVQVLERLGVLLVPGLIVGIWLVDTSANGGRLTIARQPTGPYLVSVWTTPDSPRSGRLDVSVAVMIPPEGVPVLDADVRLRAAPAGSQGASPSVLLVRGAGGNLLLHHGEIELPSHGVWRVEVMVSGSAGQGSAVFMLDVGHTSPVTGLLVLALVLVLLVTALAWRQLRTPGARPQSS